MPAHLLLHDKVEYIDRSQRDEYGTVEAAPVFCQHLSRGDKPKQWHECFTFSKHLVQIQDIMDFLLVNVGTGNISYINFMGYRCEPLGLPLQVLCYVLHHTFWWGFTFCVLGGILWYLDHDWNYSMEPYMSWICFSGDCLRIITW